MLFASVNVSEERKGMRHLLEALNRLQLDNLVPVCVGHAADSSEFYPGTITLGYVDDPVRSAMIYSAADIFVGPSLQEAFGQVFIEAAACGTPSIGYPVDGVREAIEHGVTGRVATAIKPAALADEIQRLYYDTQHREDLAVWGRIAVENEWSLRSCYHQINQQLSQSADELGFRPPANIAFDPQLTAGIMRGKGRRVGVLEKSETGIQFGGGFADQERIELANGQDGYARWVVNDHCEFSVNVDQPQTIRAELLNPVANQRAQIFCDDELINTIAIEAKQNFFDAETVDLVEGIGPGQFQIRIEFSGTVAEQNGSRELAMLIADLRFAPVESKPDKLQEPMVHNPAA